MLHINTVLLFVVVGFASPVYSGSVGAFNESDIVCPANHVIVVIEEFVYSTHKVVQHR